MTIHSVYCAKVGIINDISFFLIIRGSAGILQPMRHPLRRTLRLRWGYEERAITSHCTCHCQPAPTPQGGVLTTRQSQDITHIVRLLSRSIGINYTSQ